MQLSLVFAILLATAMAASVSINPGPPGWHSLGCYSDNVQGRALPYGVPVVGGASNMTVAGCASACSSYTYWGLEYSQECFCGNNITSPVINSTICGMPCRGNGTEYCGGSNALNVYTVGPAPTGMLQPKYDCETAIDEELYSLVSGQQHCHFHRSQWSYLSG
jgi:hypothetical protein